MLRCLSGASCCVRAARWHAARVCTADASARLQGVVRGLPARITVPAPAGGRPAHESRRANPQHAPRRQPRGCLLADAGRLIGRLRHPRHPAGVGDELAPPASPARMIDPAVSWSPALQSITPDIPAPSRVILTILAVILTISGVILTTVYGGCTVREQVVPRKGRKLCADCAQIAQTPP